MNSWTAAMYCTRWTERQWEIQRKAGPARCGVNSLPDPDDVTERIDAFEQVPKVELHVHLDCSLTYQAVRELSPNLTLEEFNRKFVAPVRCRDLAEFLDCVTHSVDFLQSRAALRLAVESLFSQWLADGVIYGEFRFAPLLHSRNGLAPESIVETVLEVSQEQSTGTGIDASVILCTLRHFSPEESMKTAALVKTYRENGVCALDIAADEAAYPLTPHLEAFRVVRDAGIFTTAHAGEARGAQSVMETLSQLSPNRIGHGVRSIEDPRIVEELLRRNVHLEVCPSCNIQIGVYPSLAEHSLADLRERGVSVGINTDGRTAVNTSLSEDYARIAATFGWSGADFQSANEAAAEAAFTDPSTREKIARRLSAAGGSS